MDSTSYVVSLDIRYLSDSQKSKMMWGGAFNVRNIHIENIPIEYALDILENLDTEFNLSNTEIKDAGVLNIIIKKNESQSPSQRKISSINGMTDSDKKISILEAIEGIKKTHGL